MTVFNNGDKVVTPFGRVGVVDNGPSCKSICSDTMPWAYCHVKHTDSAVPMRDMFRVTKLRHATDEEKAKL